MSTPFRSVAVLGIGIMGAAVARNLQRRGFAVRAWNRTPQRAQALQEEGVQVFEQAVDAVRGAEVIITLAKDGPAVLAAMEQAGPALEPGMLWLQMATVGVQACDELHGFAQARGLVFYDAPVLGTRQPAEQGQLLVLGAGPEKYRAQLQSLFDAIAKRVTWVSEVPGGGSRLKLALNSWVLALTHGAAECLALARGLGVDPALVVELVTGGPLDSGYFQAKTAAMLNDDYRPSFTLANALKDAQLMVAAAQQAGVKVDLAEAGIQRFQRALDKGHGDKDMAASYLG
ncbi:MULTISPECIES: NAD(P)-dependent oxidoreductase [Pseudomonas]|uniref:NAD(P)-dependent oxidoreductase n=1 Tax=Pseudomonas sessilinigenes TaxID=658629 RepID=A0ABX8MWG8_9PSED|nr:MULTISPECIES: NAD(P)-dependent oxidoreductase [Pseudomonas]AZC24665.1 3-hydroxyisobutyrate dehydrogenase family protein [Pseudomonas sessilinigenes]QXH43589.1 NAD(P)-dependent oxidoreductase [Pseudomonas sessilinigenes]UMZ14883.1 NAD(P)-dependent oxidoreductase [Pseudomonas sp. MPFS]